MKKFIFFTFIISGILYVSLCGNILTAKVKYNTYSNSRFGYSIDYPSDFKKVRHLLIMTAEHLLHLMESSAISSWI